MGVYSKEDIIRIVREEEIEFVRLQFTDIFGMLKNVAITASQIEKAVSNQCMFDGSSIEGFVRIDESDQYLYPDLKSFRIFPWRPSHGKVARLICDVYNTDGTPFVGDPRYVLKRVIQKANDMGYDRFNVGPEAEFFLFKTDEEARQALQQGRVDAYVIDNNMQQSALGREPGKYKIAGKPFGSKEPCGIGLPLESDGGALVNDFLKKIEGDGTWTELWQICIGDRTGDTNVPELPEIGA